MTDTPAPTPDHDAELPIIHAGARVGVLIDIAVVGWSRSLVGKGERNRVEAGNYMDPVEAGLTALSMLYSRSQLIGIVDAVIRDHPDAGA